MPPCLGVLKPWRGSAPLNGEQGGGSINHYFLNSYSVSATPVGGESRAEDVCELVKVISTQQPRSPLPDAPVPLEANNSRAQAVLATRDLMFCLNSSSCVRGQKTAVDERHQPFWNGQSVYEQCFETPLYSPE